MQVDDKESRVFEARFSVLGLSSLVLAGVGFCLAALWMVGAFGLEWHARQPNIITNIFVIIVIGFFGPLTLWYASLLPKRGPAVVIDQNGMIDRHYSDELIPWQAIRGFQVNEVSHGALGFTVWRHRYIEYAPSTGFRHNIKGVRRIGLLVQRFSRGSMTRLPHLTLSCSFDDLLSALQTIPPPHLRPKG